MSDFVTIPLDVLLDAIDGERDSYDSGHLEHLAKKYIPEDVWKARLVNWYEQSCVPESIWRARLENGFHDG